MSDNSCGSYDAEYYKDDVVNTFKLYRNAEYTSVLNEPDTSYFYGHTLLADSMNTKVMGLNNSVMMNVNTKSVDKIDYTDYGHTDDLESGLAYNGERLDETGLIYLRARYYNPELSRFIQIDNNYCGENTRLETKTNGSCRLRFKQKYGVFVKNLLDTLGTIYA